MTHTDKGHFARKHPADRKVNPEIVNAAKSQVSEGTISCAEAFSMASKLNVSPEEVGFTLDFLEIPIIKCQLGLHGYKPTRKIVEPLEKVSTELGSMIREMLVNGRLPCASAWHIAERFGLRKMEVSSACEALKIKISSCQLGTF